MFTFEIDLTETGAQNYREVIALVFEYLRKVKEEWLADGQTLDLFDEVKILS